MKKPLAVVVMVLQVSCNVLPEQEPVDLYQLPPPVVESAAGGPRLSSLRIDRPVSSEALSSNQLLIMPGENQFQSFPGVRLTAVVPLLWRDWLLDAFWRDGRVDGLSASSEGLSSRLELGGTLRAFHVQYTGSSPQAVVQYDAILIDTSARTILSRRRFEARQQMLSMDVSAAIDAMGLAANQLAGQIITWTLEHGQ